MRPIQLHGHTRPLTQIKYNREGDLIFSSARDKFVNVWFSHSGERLGTYDGHKGAVYDLDIGYDSRRLLTASADNSVRLWDVSNGTELFQWGFKSPVRAVEFALGDREALVLTDSVMGNPGLLSIYPVANSAGSQTDVPLQSVIVSGNGGKATLAKWGNLNKYIFTAHEDGVIMKWNAKTGERMCSVRLHEAAVTDLKVSRDYTFILTTSKDCTSKIIDSESMEVIKIYKSDRPLNAVANSPLFDHIILGGGQEARDVTTTSARAGRFEICFFHRVYENEIGRLKGHFSPVNTLDFHPNGKSFCSGAEEGYARIYHFDADYFDYDKE